MEKEPNTPIDPVSENGESGIEAGGDDAIPGPVEDAAPMAHSDGHGSQMDDEKEIARLRGEQGLHINTSSDEKKTEDVLPTSDQPLFNYEKRFQIPEDILLRERLEGIQKVFRNFQKEYPEALSFTMYGSMVKNTATFESDIDGTLFIDISPTGDKEMDDKILSNVKSGYYLDRFKNILQNSLSLTPEQVQKDVTLETISETDVATAAEKYIFKRKLYQEEREVWERSRRDTGKTEETMFGAIPVYEYDTEMPEPPGLPANITAMFNLDIGGKIRKYRNQFLVSLQSLEPEQADAICRDIYAYLSFSEGNKRNEITRLPQHYDDFKRTYLKL